MRRIYKYELEITDKQDVEMPLGAQMLSVQMQGDKLCVWALITTGREQEVRHIEIYGTGRDIGNENQMNIFHRGTVQDGGLVWHVF